MAAGGLIIDPDALSYTLKRVSASVSYNGTSTVTVVSALPHGYTTGDLVHIGGIDVEEFDGNYTVTVTDTTTFTYPMTGTLMVPTTPGYSYPAIHELLVDQVRKTVKLIRVGNMTSDGVTLKCIYSKLKELWISDATLIKFPFPMTPITDEQFEFKDGWTVENRFSSVTELKIPNTSGVSGEFTITTTGGGFVNVTPGAYIGYNIAGLPANTGGSSGQEGAKVVTISGDFNTITMDKANTATWGPVTVKFWTKNDHTYNLIRTGGWATKGTDGNTREEWANITSLGNLGAQGTIVTLTAFAATVDTTAVTCASTAGLVAGSFITAPGLYEGTTIVSIDSATELTVSKVAKATVSGGIATVRPKDQIYFQLGSSTVSGKVFSLTGAVNQALRTKVYQTSFTADTTSATTAITAMSWASQTVTVTSTAHGLLVGEYVAIAGVTPAQYNGVYRVATVADANTFTFVLAYNYGTVTTQGTASSSPNLKNVSSIAGLYVGLTVSGTGIASESYIQAINGTTVSLTKGATATGSTVTINTGSDASGASSVLKIYVREQGYTYAVATKEQVGETTLTYKKYALPLSNSADLKVSHTDVQIDANGDNTADVAPYSTMSITWFASPQARTIGGVSRDFNVIIDADTGLAEGASGTASTAEIYEFVQWSLRRTSDIDAGAGTKTGNITRELLKFVGDTLYTLYDVDGGVYIDNFNTADINNIVFADNTGINRTYPYTAAGAILPNTYLVADGAGSNAIYRMFFKQLKAGQKYGTVDALLVNKADNTTPISGIVTGATLPFDFDYDGNTQAEWTASTSYVADDEYRVLNGTTVEWRKVNTPYTSGGTFGVTDTSNTTTISGPSVIVTALGKSTAQAVVSEGSIARSTTNNISLVAALERNYSNPI